MLLVETIYKAGCILPGGGVLKDEPAVEAAHRHLKTETGLTVTLTHYLAVDQVPFNPANEHSEGYNQVFNGGVLTPRQAEAVLAHDGSRGGVRACVWTYPDQGGEHCKPEQASRIRHALRAAENGPGLPVLFHGQPLVTT